MLPAFSERLLTWFDEHGRHDLPWQQARSAYRVWVSEIMLQQTQVSTVVPYFEAFVARFPTLQTLAAAPLDEVLHSWSGLGYYARARNLHRAAKLLVDTHGGEFPVDLQALAALPGIGRSTAGAILALSLGQRAPILDGNVKRVLARHRCIDGLPTLPATARALWQVAEEFTPTTRVADYTQAMMDLGATLCGRTQPACGRCPVHTDCLAAARGAQLSYPARKPRKTLPRRATCMLVLARVDHADLLLERRAASGIWGGLWAFPEVSDAAAAAVWCANHDLAPCGVIQPLADITHTFTHFQLKITPLLLWVTERGTRCMDSDRLLWYNAATPAAVGLPQPVRDLVRSISLTAKEFS